MPPAAWRGILLVWLALILFGTVLVGMHWEELTADITARVFTGDNMLILALLYPLLKAFHEFGHALAVKALGGSCREMGLKIQKAANAHDPHACGIEGSNGHFFRAEPGRTQGAERRDALVIEPGASLQTRAAVRQQRFGFQRKAVNMLGANQVIRVLRRQLIAVRFVHQIQRARREVQGALAPGDNGAAQPLLRELDAAEQACQPAADDNGIKFHRVAPSQDRKAPGRPSG